VKPVRSKRLRAFLLGLMTIAPAYAPALDSPGGVGGKVGDYAHQPPFSRTDLWDNVLRLLNERDGAVTKERFEQVFGIQFVAVRRESDATTYLLEAGKDWYFGAHLTIYNDKFKFAAPLNGAHSDWGIDWSRTFDSKAEPKCLTADQVRADLLASGWTSPWQSWGFEERYREETAKTLRERAPPGGYTYPPSVPPEPFGAQFSRYVEDPGVHLPEGLIFAAGDFADSCVTGINVTAGI